MKFKKVFLNTVYISVISTLILSPVLAAEVVNYPAKLEAIIFVPFKKLVSQLQTSFQNKPLSFQETLPAYRMQTDDGVIQVVSDRIDLTASLQSKSIQNPENQELKIGLVLNQASVMVQNLNILVTVKRDLGFGLATLHLNMTCQQARINLQNNNPIQAHMNLHQGAASVARIEWDLSTTQVATELIGCNEIAGFDAELKNQIKSFVQQSFAIETLRHLINTKINLVLNDSISNALYEALTKNNIKAEQKHNIDEKGNLWIFSSDETLNSFAQSTLTTVAQSTTTMMLVKKAGIEDIIKNNLNDVLSKNTISSKKFSALNSLTCSRFSQFFVWPALRSLNKCFDLQIQNRIQSVELKNLSTLEMKVKLGSWASGEGHTLAYFESQVSVYPAVPQANIISLHGQQDSTFTSWSGRSTRISTGLIKTALQVLLNSTITNLSKSDAFSFFKKNTSVKQIGTDALMLAID